MAKSFSMESLNAAQRKAVQTLQGPVLIQAGSPSARSIKKPHSAASTISISRFLRITRFARKVQQAGRLPARRIQYKAGRH